MEEDRGAGANKLRRFLSNSQFLLLTSYFFRPLFENSFRLRTGEDFLKSQVVSKRVPFQRVRKSESEIIKSKREGTDD